MTNPYESPQTPPQPPYYPQAHEGDATGGIIPYKNVYALVAYYLGILSLLSCVMPIPFGIVPLVLGIMGLRARARNPVIKGSVHAWIGIVLGGLSTLGSLFMIFAITIALMSDLKR